MSHALTTLTEKEKDALRLIVRGHDAKSAAKTLGLSVHTINERLRHARRKLAVTSSREAARLLHEREREAPEKSVSQSLGDAQAPPVLDPQSRAAYPRRAPFWIGGMGIMLIAAVVLTLVLPAVGPETGPDAASTIATPQELDEGTVTAHLALVEVDKEPEQAARAWLALVDAADWQASYDAAGASFRDPNTVEGWQAASQQERVPRGSVIKRELIESQFVNAPPKGFRLMRYLTEFEDGRVAIESVTLEREADGLKVVGYVID